MPASEQEHILVIKLGALGDFVQAFGPMKSIRSHHPDAHIILLTTAPFENFARLCGYFDDVIIDAKPKFYQFAQWKQLKRTLRAYNFDRVYDLQNNDRTSFYYKLFHPKPEWVGVAKGASHRNESPTRTAGHAFDGHVQTLALAGIKNIHIDDLSWLAGDIAALNIPERYVLIVPGSAPEHPYKRWPASYYADLAKNLNDQGSVPVVIGALAEVGAAREICDVCPQAMNLIGQTSLAQVATLARGAKAAVGNDTGPMHIIAATGCESLILFSKHSDPVKHLAKGENVRMLYMDDLQNLAVDEVLGALKN